MNVSVRTATSADLDALLPLIAQLSTGHKSYDSPDREAASDALNWIARSPDVALLVAEADGAIVGTVTAAVIPILTANARPFMILEAMVVNANARRLGVGRALLDRALEIAKERRCSKVELQSRKERSWAHAFYEACGFRQVSNAFKIYLD